MLLFFASFTSSHVSCWRTSFNPGQPPPNITPTPTCKTSTTQNETTVFNDSSQARLDIIYFYGSFCSIKHKINSFRYRRHTYHHPSNSKLCRSPKLCEWQFWAKRATLTIVCSAGFPFPKPSSFGTNKKESLFHLSTKRKEQTSKCYPRRQLTTRCYGRKSIKHQRTLYDRDKNGLCPIISQTWWDVAWQLGKTRQDKGRSRMRLSLSPVVIS